MQSPQVHPGQAAVAADQVGRPAGGQQLSNDCGAAKHWRYGAIVLQKLGAAVRRDRGGGRCLHATDSLAEAVALRVPFAMPAGTVCCHDCCPAAVLDMTILQSMQVMCRPSCLWRGQKLQLAAGPLGDLHCTKYKGCLSALSST